MTAGPEVLLELDFHQGLREQLDALAQEVNILLDFSLAQEALEAHAQLIGHRRGPPVR